MRCAGCGSLAADMTSMVHSPSCKHARLFPAPTVAPEHWSVGTRLELLMLEEELKYRNGPAFRAWARHRAGWLRGELDRGVREELAAAGLRSEPEWMRDPPPTPRNTGTPQVCSCVNPPSLAIGETTCPSCGGLALR